MLHEMEQGFFYDEDVNRSKDYSVNDDEPKDTITQASTNHVAVEYSRSPQRYLSPFLHHPILLQILSVYLYFLRSIASKSTSHHCG